MTFPSFYIRITSVLSILALATLTLAATTDTASAGVLRFLFGGGKAKNVNWDNASGKQRVRFSREYAPGTIVVSFADRRLYYVAERGVAISYPVGTPTGEARWSGVSHVSRKRENPKWTPTPDMRVENPELPAYMPGGHPRNPLGPRALYLGDTLYRIHGTDAPWTIGQEVSHGCVRLYNADIIDLYERVPVGAKVIVTWKRFYA
jgi:lipoprotein-anchoring transpeptidase ErfK/SrfK